LNRIAADSPTGTLASQDIERWRQGFRAATRPLTGTDSIAATRALESIDDFVTNPQETLNALRNSVLTSGKQAYDIDDALRSAQNTARTAANDTARAEAAFNAAPAADVAAKKAAADALTAARSAQAAAQKAADDLVAPAKAAADQFKTNSDDMVASDPAMRDVAKAHGAAVKKAADADRAATYADVRYNSLARQTMAAEAEELAAAQAYEAAKVKFAGSKFFARDTGKAKKAFDAATTRAADLKKQADEAFNRRDAADTARGVADTQRNSALTDMHRKQLELAKADADAATKSSKRTTEMAAARGTYPDVRNMEQFEAMPAEARAARGNTRESLQNQVRLFIRQSDGYEFRRLPADTQRALLRFSRGGSATERTLNFIGDFLIPGFGGRNLMGTALSLISGASAATGGGILPLAAQMATGFGAKATANAMAGSGFNRVRDMVAHGVNLPPRTPQNIVSAAARNAMLAQANNRGQR
jgi:hypothetical protein